MGVENSLREGELRRFEAAPGAPLYDLRRFSRLLTEGAELYGTATKSSRKALAEGVSTR